MSPPPRGHLTLVLGGARSGKSALAEQLAAAQAGPAGRVNYVATSSVGGDDADFAARVAAHRDRRPTTWVTVEAGVELADVVRGVTGPVLLDSLGGWVARLPDFAADGPALASALRRRHDTTVVVSEEVGLGVHPSTESGRRFRDALGAVNLEVAAVADQALLVVAGRVIPLERFVP